MVVHRGEIEKSLINRDRHERGRILFQHVKHLRGNAAVFVIMRAAQNTTGTNPSGLKARHARLDAEFFGRPVGRDDNAVAAPSAADPHGPALQFFIERDFATRKKTVAIHMQNPVGLRLVQNISI